MRDFSEGEFGRIFCGAERRKKPGFPGLRYRSGPDRGRSRLLRIPPIPCAAKGLINLRTMGKMGADTEVSSPTL
jgi:hypothetical protein